MPRHHAASIRPAPPRCLLRLDCQPDSRPNVPPVKVASIEHQAGAPRPASDTAPTPCRVISRFAARQTSISGIIERVCSHIPLPPPSPPPVRAVVVLLWMGCAWQVFGRRAARQHEQH
jgi:hypothetical protein